ncbi:MAG: lipopolysaccharide kinase InaA family protein, partial [Holophagales bacterium]|nr:lipopolysaccharide kinase InaA family protein [Holophagales bacterium]
VSDAVIFRDPLPAVVARLVDPGSATETVHWGRNYLYRVALPGEAGAVDLVVKQFRNQGRRKELDRQLRGSKATRSWRNALAFHRAGIPTAPPVMVIESRRPSGPSFFVTRHVPGVFEARYIFRAAAAGRLDEEFPGFDYPAFLRSLGRAIAHVHAAGLFHRDLSIGNVLLPRRALRPEPEDLAIIDLNRARIRSGGLGFWERNRDLCRFPVGGRDARRQLLEGYWGRRPGWIEKGVYALCHHGFFFKIGFKKMVRAPFRRLAEHLRPRRAHAHIPAAPQSAGARDKIVWDHLSDQPHQHASRLEKLRVRLADIPSHLGHAAVLLAAAPRIAVRYRRLRRGLYGQPVPWGGVGVCVRPWPEAPEELLTAVEDLGLRHVLLRLHPWQEQHEAEAELARELHTRGYDLAFSLPQNRDLVSQPDLWRRRIEELAEIFVPYGRAFQVGQAVNRSKWGVWRYGEYVRLARDAAEILRRHPGVRVLGPSVIDFELHSTAAIVNRPDCPRFDALASLLYVDRRGAPENAQLGFDTVGKVLLTRAIAETALACGPESWITEVNWPLWEGPHSPAGKSVSVSEPDQADYLSRYYLQALTTGAVERVFWWQMVARGYGLISPRDAEGEARGLRRRPAFYALRTLGRTLAGSRFLGRLPSPEGTWLMHFEKPAAGDGSATDGRSEATAESAETWIAAWSEHGRQRVTLPEPWQGERPRAILEQDGSSAEDESGDRIVLLASTRYFRI